MNRYEPRSYQSGSGVFATVMERATCGRYITYESHKQEIESLQARLDALQSKPKDSISISAIIAEHVEDALREAVRKTVEEMFKSEFKYNGDPCHRTTDSIINELAAGPGKTVKADFNKANELTGRAGFTFGNSLVGGGVIAQNLMEFDVAECKSSLERKVAVCYYVAGNMFIKGCEYEYEVDELDERVIHITQDAFASDLKDEHRWDAVKSGRAWSEELKLTDAYEIVKPNGNVVANFYIK